MSASAPLAASITPPKLSAASSDADLRATIRRMPGIVQTTRAEAAACHHRLIQNPNIPSAELGISNYWTQQSWRYQAALPRGMIGMIENPAENEAALVAAFRIILDARDALRELEADLPLLTHGDLMMLRGQMLPLDAQAALGAIWSKGPGLAGWQARRQAAAEAAQAQIDETRNRQTEAYAAQSRAARHEAACTLLRRLAADGVRLSVTKGTLLAHPAALVSDAHRSALREFSAELVAILTAPPEAIAEPPAAA